MSKIVKRIREQKFTKKRNPYKKYQKASWIWSDIFEEIDLLKISMNDGFIKFVAKKHGINYKTLRNKYCKHSNNTVDVYDINNEKRGGTNKKFTENEEQQIFNYLKHNFIDKNKMLCNEIIKLYTIDFFKNLYPDKTFNGSNGWINMFKKRWNLSTVKCSISKISTTIYSDEEINIFLDKCKTAYNSVGGNFFLI
jgi:hypothetical protein